VSITSRLRGGVYVDGYNLYHAIDDLGQPHLKWLDLWRLAQNFAKGHAHSVDRVVFCTAFFPGDAGKRARHEAYIAALKARGIEVVLGHAVREPMDCAGCGRRWEQPREKETDINVALSLFRDASLGRIDVAFLVTADTDQAATLRFVGQQFPHIRRIVVTPPGREKSKHLRDLSHANMSLDRDRLDAAVFPAIVTPPSGRTVIRPKEYAPPDGWVHPDDRLR
jgi:hypothetical protein